MMARLSATSATRPAGQRAGSEISATSSLLDSDKENGTRRTSLGKRKSAAATMATPHATQSGKRRKLGESQVPNTPRPILFDPDQPEDIKRQTIKKYRELNNTLLENRSEYLQKNSKGIKDTLDKADELYENVKQTSTATLDSRLLVNTSDLAYKKLTALTLGESSTGIDVDDFISRCIAYMKTDTNTAQPTATQRRRRRQGDEEDSDDEQEESQELDWAHLGKTLCFQANRRPCLSSHLLGPLSVQKKIRQPTQRKATQRTQPTGPATRPMMLNEEELDKQEAASLTQICSEIARLLGEAQESGVTKVEQEALNISEEGQDPTDEQITALYRKHNIASNGGIPLVNFCFNPRSFGQTVENLFYIAFLVKEGKVGVDFDDDGMPTLALAIERGVGQRQERPRNQSIFHIDFDTWEDLTESFGITKSIIPHRRQEDWELDDGVIVPGEEHTSRRRASTSSEESDLYGAA